MATRRVQIELSDVERNVYEPVELTLVQHPSETDVYLTTRVLAYALSTERGIAFTRGLAEPDEPAVWVKDDTGQVVRWIEVGRPKPDRVQKALRATRAVDVFCHHRDDAYAASLEEVKRPKGATLRLYLLEPRFVEELAGRLGERSKLELTRSEGQLYATVGGESLAGAIEERWPAGAD